MCLCCLAGAKKKDVKKQPIDLLPHIERDVEIHTFSLFSYLQHACWFFFSYITKNRGGQKLGT